jgi:hypothetical protein
VDGEGERGRSSKRWWSGGPRADGEEGRDQQMMETLGRMQRGGRREGEEGGEEGEGRGSAVQKLIETTLMFRVWLCVAPDLGTGEMCTVCEGGGASFM